MSRGASSGRRLATRKVAKPWGMNQLPSPFSAPEGERIGEVWFEPPPELDDLLVKYLFTSDKLSVQVHPSDADAPAGSRGKEECWVVLEADPGAALAVGLKEEVSIETLRQAALDGSIEQLLAWHPVAAGDFFYIAAGTIHAIGAGIMLVEVQQNSDTTYRLFDYGRPRELHLDDGLAVARRGPPPAELRRKLPDGGAVSLVKGPHFRLDRLDGPPDEETAARYCGPLLIVPLDGDVAIGDETLKPGECGFAMSLEAADFVGSRQALLAQTV